MDYVEMMGSFDRVLDLAPLSTTHWHIENNKFVRMGCAVVDGYLSLSILRRIRSQAKASLLVSSSKLNEIVSFAPVGADAYSMKSGKYIATIGEHFYLVATDGKLSKVVCASDIAELIYMDHAKTYTNKAN
ncbi:hypothetical protein [Acinetobacter chengduensis]|uniref:Uncharacterized protein n=1 Tax=Acinetobacter chengduensis TaxID=2420890 RepID=A0ABX9TSZ3_9GAMM|nr:hypothetical protein [Acinetobacter chengduensis]RLL19027.1 hypothetical protein D9K81_14835 [Acinetobacter chengduensis]